MRNPYKEMQALFVQGGASVACTTDAYVTRLGRRLRLPDEERQL